MELRRLMYFSRVAKLGSISRAAESFHVSQPALSRQMRLLQEGLDASLFERHPRGIELTSVGQRLHERIEGPLQEIEDALREASRTRRERTKTVPVAMLESVADLLAGPLAARIKAEMPEIVFEIVEGSMKDLVEWLMNGEVSQAVMLSPNSASATPEYKRSISEFSIHDLLIDEIVLIGPPSSDISEDGTVSSDILDRIPIVDQKNSTYPYPGTLPTKVYDQNAYVSNSMNMTKAFAKNGIAYGLLPYSSVQKEYNEGSLKVFRFSENAIQRHIALVENKVKYDSYNQKISKYIVSEVNNLILNGTWRPYNT